MSVVQHTCLCLTDQAPYTAVLSSTLRRHAHCQQLAMRHGTPVVINDSLLLVVGCVVQVQALPRLLASVQLKLCVTATVVTVMLNVT
jgi:hypothetical protein